MEKFNRMLVVALFWFAVFGADAEASFENLAKRLIDEGYDTGTISAFYADPRCEFLPAIAQINIKNVEDTLAHLSFLLEKNLNIARDYYSRHWETLKRFEVQTRVPAEIVVAILLIETKCGLDKDKAPVFNVLSSIAISAEDVQVLKSFDALKEKFSELTIEEVRRRARSRSRWAYKELKAFIQWSVRHAPGRLFDIRGSWAGALGLPQFMPTSLSPYSADGDGDGRIDLYTDADAIASVCKYLRQNGWKAGRPARQQRKVIWRYNHSPLYVDAVLGIAERIAE